MNPQILNILERNLIPLGVAHGVIDKIVGEIEDCGNINLNEFRCEYVDSDGQTKYQNVQAKDYTGAWIKFKQIHPNTEPRTILDII